MDQSNGTRYLFECNRWLSKDEGDGKVERVLSADEDDETSSQASSFSSPSRNASPAQVGLFLVVYRKSSPLVQETRKINGLSQGTKCGVFLSFG